MNKITKRLIAFIMYINYQFNKLIKLTEGYIIVSNKKQKVDSITKWYYEEDNNIQYYQFSKETLPKHYYLHEIIASNFIPELPSIDFNNLEEELSIDDIEKLMKKWVINPKEHLWVKSLIQELNKDKLYTLEELRFHCTRFAHKSRLNSCITNNDTITLFDSEYIQSLQPKTEWDIEIEHTCKGIKREGESCTLNNKCTYPNCGQIKITKIC